MPVQLSIRPWQWVLFALAFLAMAAGVTLYWKGQADRARENLRQTVLAVGQSDRATLQREWAGRLDWTPSISEPVALAVMPRTKYLEFDSIYAAYEGQRVVATLALASMGGFYNGLVINNRKYPRTILERPLTPPETRGLDRLIGLLEARLQETGKINPQSNRYGWTQMVLQVARDIRKAQSPPLPTQIRQAVR